MMDAIVQFVRNFLCCIKGWNVLGRTWLYDPSITQSYYDFPYPLNQTTPLEVIISVTQLYAVLSMSYGGYKTLTCSYGKLQRIQRLMDVRCSSGSVKKNNQQADRLINSSLIDEATSALRGMFVGLNVFFIGLAFFWLFSTSWHVHTTEWIGGVRGVIHALIVMEIALLPLLWYMYQDGSLMILKSIAYTKMATTIEDTGKVVLPTKATTTTTTITESDIDLQTLQAFEDWKPFWAGGVDYNLLPQINVSFKTTSKASSLKGSKNDSTREAQQMNDEVEKVQTVITDIVTKVNKNNSDTDDSKEKEMKLFREDLCERLYNKASTNMWEGYREKYVYFTLNLVAFYAYMLPVLVFYFDDDNDQPAVVQYAKFNMTNTDADWHGNFAGDLAWTIEPIVILASPFLLSSWSSSPTTKSSRRKSTAKKDKVKAE